MKRAKNFRIHLKEYFESIGYHNTNLIDKDEDESFTYIIQTSYFNGSKIRWSGMNTATSAYKKLLDGFMEIFIAQVLIHNTKTLVNETNIALCFISFDDDVMVNLNMKERTWKIEHY